MREGSMVYIDAKDKRKKGVRGKRVNVDKTQDEDSEDPRGCGHGL